MSASHQVVAIASGKGGVGKSTVTTNLAVALSQQGLSVGLLDADIYGPSQQLMLGVPESATPDQQDGEFLLPVEAHGLKTMSMGYLASARTPMVWRGPMASSAMSQLLEKTLWGDIDILLVDMPPGTGDIQLTLAQRATLSGAVIVTTPQDIALPELIGCLPLEISPLLWQLMGWRWRETLRCAPTTNYWTMKMW